MEKHERFVSSKCRHSSAEGETRARQESFQKVFRVRRRSPSDLVAKVGDANPVISLLRVSVARP